MMSIEHVIWHMEDSAWLAMLNCSHRDLTTSSALAKVLTVRMAWASNPKS
jgi:hypothetical protein